MDTVKSERIVKAYREMEPKLIRRNLSFSITLETKMEGFFPLLCPVRETDWIPGWTTEVLYSESGLAEDRIVFRTDETNSHGPGIWTFTGFEKNEYVELVFVQTDVINAIRIDVTDNGNGKVNATWNVTATALTEKGNGIVKNMPTSDEREQVLYMLLTDYLKNGNIDKSDEVIRRFNNRKLKLMRKEIEFSGTFETDVKTFFPLLCPAREADWIPGWDCKLVYTDSGYAEANCVFVTDHENPFGEGVWAFTDYERDSFIEFVSISDNIIIHCRIVVTDNGDGTVTALWYPVVTALTEKGNELVDNFGSKEDFENGLVKSLGEYLDGEGPTGAHHFH